MAASNVPDAGHDAEDAINQSQSVVEYLKQAALATTPTASPHLCLACAQMTGTPSGLRDLISPEGYDHSAFPDVQKAATQGCAFCASILSIVSSGQLYAPDTHGVLRRVHLDASVRTLIIASSRQMAHYDNLGFSKAPVLVLDAITVYWIYGRQRCSFRTPAKNFDGFQDQSVEFSVFTDVSDSFHVCLTEVEGSPALVSFKQHALSISVTSDLVIHQSKQLLQECVVHHSTTCPSELNCPLPPRVIDVDCEQNPQRLGLHISRADEHAQYTALSYCWGEAPHGFVTTESTLQNPSLLLWANLPASIRDAVTVTRSLGIRYLWVDALCIVQDNEKDKTEQIKQMGRIYKNATITIVAANSPGVSDGFLEDRLVPSIAFPIARIGGPAARLWVHGITADIPEDPIDKRGWTLQESLLSPRIVYYGSKDLIWKCQGKPFQPVIESHNLYKPEHTRRLPSSVFGIHIPSHTPAVREIWPGIVSEFSQRKLSLEVDNFRALGGIAEELQVASGDRYIAGLWKGEFASSLAWFRTFRMIHNAADYSPSRRPTWSWLTNLSPARQIHIVEDDDPNKRIELESWSVELADESAPFGHITGGTLELTGLVIKTTELVSDVVETLEVMLDSGVNDEEAQHAGNYVGQQYYYLLVGISGNGTIALLLKAQDDDSFIRCGIISLESSKSLAIWSMKEVQRMKIKLV